MQGTWKPYDDRKSTACYFGGKKKFKHVLIQCVGFSKYELYETLCDFDSVVSYTQDHPITWTIILLLTKNEPRNVFEMEF